MTFTRDGVSYTVAGWSRRWPPRTRRGGCDDHRAPIEARGLVKRYGHITAVDDVDLNVSAGDVYGYLGPNGAGKTTSLRMLLGLIRPDAGSARLFGRDPLEEGARALDGVAGFVEAPRFYPYMSGRRNLEMAAALDGDGAERRIDEALDTVDLADRARTRSAATRTGCASGSASPGRCCATRGCCCSTSRPPGWIRAACATCAR